MSQQEFGFLQKLPFWPENKIQNSAQPTGFQQSCTAMEKHEKIPTFWKIWNVSCEGIFWRNSLNTGPIRKIPTSPARAPSTHPPHFSEQLP